MKRVKYALGAAAFTPAIAGAVAVPATAATANTGTAPSAAKAVSLRHAAAALSSCTVPSSDVTRWTGLTSTWNALSIWHQGNAWGSKVCIGTVRVQRRFLNQNCVGMEFTVIGKHTSSALRGTQSACAPKGSIKTFQHVFRKEFPVGPHGVTVIVQSRYAAWSTSFSF